MKKINIPEKLKIGDTIGVISPSFGGANLFPHRLENAVKFLKKEGFKILIADHTLESTGYISATAEERARDINEMFSNKDVKAILCTIGGNHSNQILKYINFDNIKNNPKIFIGYSDISVLHYAFLKKANLQTYYGPCLMTQFGEYPEPLNYTYDYFKRIIMDDDKVDIDIKSSESWTSEILNWVTKTDLERPRILEKSHGYEWWREGSSEHEIVGGCVPSINHTLGTEYWIDPANKIFFVDIPEGHTFGEGLPISDLDSYLADLDNAGVFKSIKGLIIGRPYNYSKDQISQLKNIIYYYTKDTNYPILFNANIGHSDPIVTLPIMSTVLLDSKINKFVIKNKI